MSSATKPKPAEHDKKQNPAGLFRISEIRLPGGCERHHVLGAHLEVHHLRRCTGLGARSSRLERFESVGTRYPIFIFFFFWSLL